MERGIVGTRRVTDGHGEACIPLYCQWCIEDEARPASVGECGSGRSAVWLQSRRGLGQAQKSGTPSSSRLGKHKHRCERERGSGNGSGELCGKERATGQARGVVVPLTATTPHDTGPASRHHHHQSTSLYSKCYYYY